MDLIVAKNFATLPEAEAAKELLEGVGIRGVVKNISPLLGRGANSGEANLLVLARDLEKAKEILGE